MGKSKEWSAYEQFVAMLLDGIKSSGRKISGIQFGKNNKIQGACGQKHQIDVSFLDYSFSTPTLIGIECKRYDEDKKRVIGLDIVKVLKATIDDIFPAFHEAKDAKAILVTTTNLTSGAKRYAEYYGIKTEKLPHDNKRYTFKYENIISAGITISIKNPSHPVQAILLKKCKNCQKQFEVISNEDICSECEPKISFKDK